MEDKNPTRPLIKEQLYEERAFLHYCQRDEVSGSKLEKGLSKAFLDACEKDGLVVPLMEETRPMKNDKGEEVIERVRFYSPFQIYLVSALSPNEVGEDGLLCDGGELWGAEAKERPRYIKWTDWSSFHVDSFKNKHEPETMGVNYFRLAADFHNLVRIVHSLEDEKDYSKMDWERRRYFDRLPFLQRNLDPLRNKEITLSEFELDLDKVKILLRNLGLYTAHIDPLEHWFYYVKRHPQWRRDKLKGKAALAQDLYGLCDLVYEIVEAVSGEQLPPLLDFIHPDSLPYLHERREYAEGADIQAIKVAYKKLCEWVDTHPSLIEEIASISTGGKAIQAELKDELQKIGNGLEDYEKRYGDKRYTSGMRYIVGEEKLTLDDLDPETRQGVEHMMKQHQSIREEKREKNFTSGFDDIVDRLTKKKLP